MRLWCMIAIIALMAAPVNAGFSESPANYVPAVSDVYVGNVDAGTVTILNGATGANIGTINLPAGARPFGIAFYPSYQFGYVTDSANGKIYLITDRLLKTINTSSAYNNGIAIHPGGGFAYIASSAGTLVLDTNQKSRTFNKIIGNISGIAGPTVFTPDGSRAYITIDGSYGSISQVKVINTSSHTVSQTIQLPIPTSPQGLAATNDGTRIYVTGWVARNVSVIDSNPKSPTYNNVIEVISVAGEARDIALNPSGSLAYVTLDTGGVDVIVTTPSSTQFNRVISHINAGPLGGIHGVAISLDGRFTYVTAGISGQNRVYVVDSEPFSSNFNTLKTTFIAGNVPMGVAVKPHKSTSAFLESLIFGEINWNLLSG